MALFLHSMSLENVLLLLLATFVCQCRRHYYFVSALATPSSSSRHRRYDTSRHLATCSSMWDALACAPTPTVAWKAVFGHDGQRGEYMDGYTPEAMMQRCQQDYKWSFVVAVDEDDEDNNDDIAAALRWDEERRNMMSHLYDNPVLWEHVCMVAFAEHYLTGDPFATFQRQQQQQCEFHSGLPLYSGVVWNDWESKICDEKLAGFQQLGLDYVRLECNLQNVASPEALAGHSQLITLAHAVKACQEHQLVPCVLIQVPWREQDSSTSMEYFSQAINAFAHATRAAHVEPRQLILETRPPIGVSASEERGMTGTQRMALGQQTGQAMFQVLREAFCDDDNDDDDDTTTTLAGFCVAGGSTKGDNPTAMEDDTQNAVRQGMRQQARYHWGYDFCYWEMGAKLMLQPKVGRLWGGDTRAGRDAARELFCVNAKDMSDEIKQPLVNSMT